MFPTMAELNNNSGCRKRQRALRWNSLAISLLIIFSTMKITQANVVARTNEDLAEEKVKSVENRSSMENNDTCVTPECYDAASEITSKLDSGVKPCDDFYKFACGKFLNTAVIPFDYKYVGSASIVAMKVNEQLRTIIESEIKTDEPAYFGLVKKYYKSCMNKDAIVARGFQPLYESLDTLGGWPILNRTHWNENNFDWMDVIHKLRKFGYSPIFPIKAMVTADPRNITRRIIIVKPTNSRTREFVSSKVGKGWLQRVRNNFAYVVRILGGSPNLVSGELTDLINFQTSLSNITVLPNGTYKVTEFHTFDIHWRRYFNGLMPSGMSIRDNDLIGVFSSKYMEDVWNLISVTPKRVLANYIIGVYVYTSIKHTIAHKSGRQTVNVNSTSNNSITAPTNDESCFNSILDNLKVIVNAMYVRKYSDSETIKSVTEIAMVIRNQFDENLKKIDWLDEATRRHAREKLDAITNIIGYPDDLLDDAKMQRVFQNLEFSDDKYYENFFNLKKFNLDQSFAKLRESPLKAGDFVDIELTEVNAHFYREENYLVLHAAMLQDPFINSAKLKYLNYASMGYIIGHELIHGFDNLGRKVDKMGNSVNWWSPLTEQRYLNRQTCIVEQYGNYTFNGTSVDSLRTLAENIADNAGVNLAYHAYVNWTVTNGPEKKLPGLPYTPKQMFWLKLASTRCTKYVPQYLLPMLSEDDHSPNEFRVRGMFSNMMEFSDDFNCPVGSNMNPVKKCTVW